MAGVERALRVGIAGAAGFVGGELLRLLAAHPDVGPLRALSRSAAGRPLGEVHPALAHTRLAAQPFEAGEPAALAAEVDVLFLALAHGESQRVAEGVLAADPPLVIDLAADFRVHDRALYERFYGEHGAWPLVESFTYGLADVHGRRLAGARRIAAPGCFATATLLALHPLAAAGLLAEPPVAVALTGSTGSGTTPRRTTHHPLRAHNLFAYAAAGHRHEAEIVEQLRAAAGRDALGAVLLTHSAPLVRGIHVTATVTPARACPDPLALLREAWAGRPFVRVLEAPPELAAVVGTNFAHVHAVARDGGARVVVFAAIDNLVKGAAGQAVQAMNLALGLDEIAGLGFAGIYPC